MAASVIRLGIPWAAVQPRKGPDGFDSVYLSSIKDFVDRCGRYGIYVLVENHQDLFSERQSALPLSISLMASDGLRITSAPALKGFTGDGVSAAL